MTDQPPASAPGPSEFPCPVCGGATAHWGSVCEKSPEYVGVPAPGAAGPGFEESLTFRSALASYANHCEEDGARSRGGPHENRPATLNAAHRVVDTYFAAIAAAERRGREVGVREALNRYLGPDSAPEMEQALDLWLPEVVNAYASGSATQLAAAKSGILAAHRKALASLLPPPESPRP